MIEVKNLKKVYGNKANSYEALKGVSFEIHDGESIAIVGKSGSGKSTIMHLIAGLDKPTSGEILYDGKDLVSYKKKEIADFRNKTIGFVFQQFFMQTNLTVLENVILPLKIRGTSISERKKKALEALKMVGMESKINNKATNLSGGEKQRACIARALIGDPKIIFADEPTGNLDSENGKIVEDILFKLNKEMGITLVLVTHDEDLAKKCQHQFFIKDGLIVKKED